MCVCARLLYIRFFFFLFGLTLALEGRNGLCARQSVYIEVAARAVYMGSPVAIAL